MSTAVGDLVASLGMNTSPWSSAIAGARATLDRFKQDAVSGMGQLKQAMSTLSLGSVGGAILGGGLLVGASKAVSMFTEAEQAGKKLEAVLKATGGAAGLSSKELMEYAGDLQKVTNFGDDATVAGMAVLATFTQIKGDVFKDAVASAQDLSAVMGQDLQGSMVQIGKALNNPIEGMTALRRVGVSFTEEQQRQIANLQKQGDLTGAQRMILAELNTEFGGSAKAMADPIMQAKEAMGDLAERIGAILKPAFTELWQTANATLTRIVDGVESVWERFSDVRQTIAELWGALSENPIVQGLLTAVPVLGVVVVAAGALLPLFANIWTVASAVGTAIGAAFSLLSGPIGIAVAAIAGIAAALVWCGVEGDTWGEKFQTILGWAGEQVDKLTFVFRNFGSLAKLAVAELILYVLDKFPSLEGPITTIGETLVGTWAGAKAAFWTLVDDAKAGLANIGIYAQSAWAGLSAGFAAVASNFQVGWQRMGLFVQAFSSGFAAQFPQITQFAKDFSHYLKEDLVALKDWAVSAFSTMLDWAKKLIGVTKEAAKAAAAAGNDLAKDFLRNSGQAVDESKFGSAFNKVWKAGDKGEFVDPITAAGKAAGDVLEQNKDKLKGMSNPITAATSAFAEAAASFREKVGMSGGMKEWLEQQRAALKSDIAENEAAFKARQAKEKAEQATGGKEKKKGAASDVAKESAKPEKTELPGILEKNSEEAWKKMMEATSDRSNGTGATLSPAEQQGQMMRVLEYMATYSERTAKASEKTAENTEETSL